MQPLPLVVALVQDPPWLPAGSTATVVRSAQAPAPTGMVRLLLRRGDAALCVPRADGRLDLPTSMVPDRDPDGAATIRTLADDLLPTATPLVPAGHVRNDVPAPDADYPWPTPRCHFTVWTPTGPAEVHEPDGARWLALGPRSPLADRHWYPLVAV